MKTVFLLTVFLCGGNIFSLSCQKGFEVYPTRAKCDVALAAWLDRGWWGGRNGFCSQRDLSDDDISTYQSRGLP